MSNTSVDTLITRIGLLHDILIIGYESTILRLLSDDNKSFIQEFQYTSADKIEEKINELKEQLYKL